MNKIKIQEPHQQILYKIDLNQITQLVLQIADQSASRYFHNIYILFLTPLVPTELR